MKSAALSFIVFALLTAALAAQSVSGKTLYIYDEINDNSKPYINYFKDALTAEGLGYDAAAVSDLAGKNLAEYDRVVIYGMVMAFNMKSPIRDWLGTRPAIAGKKISLFVTANRWFLQDLFKQLQDLLNKNKADTVDAVSMATMNMDAVGIKAAVSAFIAGLK